MIIPVIYIPDSRWSSQQPGNRFVDKEKLIMSFGSHNGIILELRRIIESSKWITAPVVHVQDVFGSFFVSNIFCQNKS